LNQQPLPSNIVETFYTFDPTISPSLQHLTGTIANGHYSREALVALLRDYQLQIDNLDAHAAQSLDLLASPRSFCVVTGQQVGLMGGPSYTILKAISCLKLARELGAVPIFWAATEDHDVLEVSRTTLLSERGDLKTFQVSLPERHFVEDLLLTEQHVEEIQRFCEAAHLSWIEWSSLFQPTSRYATVMIQVMCKLFAGTGLLFIEPHLLRRSAVNFFERELRETEKIRHLLLRTSHQLEERGEKPEITFPEEDTNLFYKSAEGVRLKIHQERENFIIDKRTFSLEEMLKQLHDMPERFSTNVAARTVLQSLLLPTIAYVAGPAEMRYYAQLKQYHAYHGVGMPWIVPRLSATLIPEQAALWLNLLNIGPEMPLPAKAAATVPAQAVHFLHNLLHPREKLQERVLNWLYFQGQTRENLISEVLEKCTQNYTEAIKSHLYCYTNY
jgi:bacillithiol biosynthesis cysteine-adding enzyme BshC